MTHAGGSNWAVQTFRTQAILFDNDGVLVDSHPQVVAAWSETAQRFGLPVERLIVEAVGVPSLATLGRYLDGDELHVADQHLEALEIEYATQTEPLAGALELLASIPDGRWTIATSATTALAIARWTGAGIPYPDRVITADDVTHGKPHPEPFLRGAELLGVEPGDVIVFEDSPAGGNAGLAAGATVIAVGDQPWEHEPHARVTDLTEVSVVVDDDGSLKVTVG